MKKSVKVIIWILSIIAFIAAVMAAVNFGMYKANLSRISEYSPVVNENAVKPEIDDNGVYTFVTDRELKIMQLTDIHIGGGWMSFKKDRMAINTVAAMITAEKPDLVVLTGDQGYPVPFQSGTFNNKISTNLIITLMEQLQVPWTACLGNHDSEIYSFFSREYIGNMYADESNKFCLFSKGPDDVDGTGNHYFNVKNSEGKITQQLIFMDSHSYTDEDPLGIFWKYDNIHQNQVDWYEKVVLEAKENNPEVKSLVFFHIPLVEHRDAYTAVRENTGEAERVSGVIGEKDPYVYCGMGEDNLFEKALELGSTQAFFCGHDHDNNMVIKYKDVYFVYGYSVDYLAYIGISERGYQRGCTMITANPDGTCNINHENYYQDKYQPLYEKEAVRMTVE